MQCYYCGGEIRSPAKVCPACGHIRSRMIYVHLCGVVGGVCGSLIGFTFYDLGGALVGGLVGILACEAVATIGFRSDRPDLAKR